MLPGNSATHLAPAWRPVPPEPIAIVGMACRFPGAPGLDEFWQLLRDGRDEPTEIPADRFDVEAFYDSRPGTPGKTRSRWGGLIQDVEGLDAAFRVQRELAPWPAAERAVAGVSSFGISGTNVHVVLEEMLGRPGSTPANSPGRSMLLPLSARSPQALRDLAGTYADFPAEADRAGQEFENTCYTASVCRTHHEYRTAVAAHRRRPSQRPLPIRRAR